MLNDFLLLIFSILLVMKGSTLATAHAARLAEAFRWSKYTIGFIIIAIISILPETFVAMNAAISGVPSFGLGTLFGSNVADLTIVFFVIILLAGRGIKIENKILKGNRVFPLLLLLPILVGLDGTFSRLDGLVLLIVGAIFYALSFQRDARRARLEIEKKGLWKHGIWFAIGMFLLLFGSYIIVASATALARAAGVDPILIGMIIVGLGTTIPELMFSLKSVERRDDALAVGDILGTVLADATVVVGVLALVAPFSVAREIVYVTGIFMVVASVILLLLMRSGRVLTRKEGVFLLLFWVLFVFVELFVVR